MGETLLKPSELAKRLSVSTATVTKWRRTGVIPSIKINAVTFRFEPSEVIEALRRREGGAN